jgi:hypothetical protein
VKLCSGEGCFSSRRQLADHVSSGGTDPIADLMSAKRDLEPSPFVDNGPFRVYLVSLNLEGRSNPGAPASRVSASRLSARPMIEPEPRMFVIGEAPAEPAVIWEE